MTRDNLETQIKELVMDIDEVLGDLNDTLYKTSNKAAMQKTRVNSLNLEKLFKQYRKLTIEYSKIKKEK